MATALKLVGKEEGDKQRALDSSAIAQIDRAFGKGSVMEARRQGQDRGDQESSVNGVTSWARHGSGYRWPAERADRFRSMVPKAQERRHWRYTW